MSGFPNSRLRHCVERAVPPVREPGRPVRLDRGRGTPSWSSICSRRWARRCGAPSPNMFFFHAYTVAPTWFGSAHPMRLDAATVTWNTAPCWSGRVCRIRRWAGASGPAWISVAGWPLRRWVDGPTPGTRCRPASRPGNFSGWRRWRTGTGRRRSWMSRSTGHPRRRRRWRRPTTAGRGMSAIRMTFPRRPRIRDGDTVQFYFRVATGLDAEFNAVYNSRLDGRIVGDRSGGGDPAGRPYYWHVYTLDGYSRARTGCGGSGRDRRATAGAMGSASPALG